VAQLIAFLTVQGPQALEALKQVGMSIAALLVFVHLLLVALENWFPQLKAEDTAVGKVIAWLDKWCHGSGAWDQPAKGPVDPFEAVKTDPKAPKPSESTKGFVRFFILIAMLGTAGTARAQVVSQGPSLAFMEIRPGYAHPVEVAAGAGYQLSIGWFQANVFGEEADLLNVGATVYGSEVSQSSGATAGTLGAALFVGTLNELVAVGIGEDVLNTSGTAFGLPPYCLVMFNPLKLAFNAPPTIPGTGIGTARRFMTTYLW
jgi:hypothetical protein